MEESLAAFTAMRMKIAGATLVDMNKTLIYNDVGIAIMQYALDLCGAHFQMEVQKVNASSSVNFITTLLDKLPINDMLDWNSSGKGFVQKLDAVFQISFAASDGTLQSMLVYYKSDAGTRTANKPLANCIRARAAAEPSTLSSLQYPCAPMCSWDQSQTSTSQAVQPPSSTRCSAARKTRSTFCMD